MTAADLRHENQCHAPKAQCAPGAAIYDFSGVTAIFGAPESFSYTASAFIITDTFIPASALDLCSTGQMLPCFGVDFLPSGPDTPQHYPELTFQINTDNTVGTAFYYFPLGSNFATYGTYTTIFGNAGTLTISAVPEPPTALTLLSALPVGFVARRRPMSIPFPGGWRTR
jgi:hypothetical protein